MYIYIYIFYINLPVIFRPLWFYIRIFGVRVGAKKNDFVTL